MELILEKPPIYQNLSDLDKPAIELTNKKMTQIYLNRMLLRLLDSIVKPMIINENILYDYLDKHVLDFINNQNIEYDMYNGILLAMNSYNGIITYTYISTNASDNLERLWLVIPEHYLNAAKLNVVIEDKYHKYIGKLIGTGGFNASRIMANINTLKGNTYNETKKIIFAQRKFKKEE